jgi:hypothetical protein
MSGRWQFTPATETNSAVGSIRDERRFPQKIWRSAEATLTRYTRTYTLNDEPQPQVLFTFGFSNLNPAPSRVST